EDPGLAARLEHAVRDLLDQRPKVECSGVAHAVGAVDEDLRLAQVLLGPVHPHAERVTLEVDAPELLTPQLSPVELHAVLPLRRTTRAGAPSSPSSRSGKQTRS